MLVLLYLGCLKETIASFRDGHMFISFGINLQIEMKRIWLFLLGMFFLVRNGFCGRNGFGS